MIMEEMSNNEINCEGVVLMSCEECESKEIELIEDFRTFEGVLVQQFKCNECGNEFYDEDI